MNEELKKDHRDICPYCKGDRTVGNCNHSKVKPLTLKTMNEECKIIEREPQKGDCLRCGITKEQARTNKSCWVYGKYYGDHLRRKQ